LTDEAKDSATIPFLATSTGDDQALARAEDEIRTMCSTRKLYDYRDGSRIVIYVTA
jgi:hypothetical protein